ncbi:hypothetical protein QCE63_35150 [Caballeronia sp. LZ065]|uniref:hypothetical protein n=1 Tax=Caballeronia sp. LZ065 TaxID=3038571 RepID=UPI002855EFEB|nr:hypothetical protein [Caballeronia sp. LZ065]MDR5784634.1 hypothetical protein [Caballeronia sp. LZ065]
MGDVHQCRPCEAKGLPTVKAEAKRKASDGDLPRHVADALASASYLMRSPDENGPRVVATIAGFGSVVLGGRGGDDIEARVVRTWPDLSNAQVWRVLKYIDAGAAAAIRAATEQPGRQKDRWLDRY